MGRKPGKESWSKTAFLDGPHLNLHRAQTPGLNGMPGSELSASLSLRYNQIFYKEIVMKQKRNFRVKTAISAGEVGIDTDYAARITRAILDIPQAVISNITQSDVAQQIQEMFRNTFDD